MSDRKTSLSLGLYNADLNYIDEKYVKAEEERKRQAEIEEARRKAEEEENRRKAAEALARAEEERRRKREEEERMAKLAAARKAREEEERKRKEAEAAFQKELDAIEDETSRLEQAISDLNRKRIDLNRDLKDEESEIRIPLDEVVQQRMELGQKESKLRRDLEKFEDRSKKLRNDMDTAEQDLQQRKRLLATQRRQLQTDMLHAISNVGSAPTQASPSYPSMTSGGLGATSQADTGYKAPVPVIEKTPPSTNTASQGDSLQDQLQLLDDFLRTGVLTQAEYEDAKAKAFQAEAAKSGGRTAATSPSPSASRLDAFRQQATPALTPTSSFINNSPAVGSRVAPAQAQQNGADAQIAQLDDFLRQGVLNQAEYEDAKQKVLQDFGVQQLKVTVPNGVSGGQQMMVEHNGKLFNVVVPHGMSPGQPFLVTLPTR